MTDVLIIGGGIAGISLAARLSKFLKVVVLEKENDCGYHASGRSASVFIKNYGNEVIRELNYASHNYLENVNGGVLSPRGMMMLGLKNDKEDFLEDSKNLGLSMISMDEAISKVPILKRDSCDFVAFNEDVYDLDANLLLQNFIQEARHNGAKIEIGSQVTKIDYVKDSWKVFTEKGNYSAKILVNAAGAWVDEIANLAGIPSLGFTACRRSMARVPTPGENDPSYWPILLGVKEDWYAKPDAGQLIISPAEEEVVEPHDAWAEDLTLAEGIDRFQKFINHEIIRVTSNWAGLRTFSPDRSLVVGRAARNPNFFWLAGQGGYGFQTAAAVSELATELILEKIPTLPTKIHSALSPQRFN